MDIAVLNTALFLGLFLGFKHATEADHVVAVSTIVSENKNPLRGIWVGVSWGLGHTTPLLLVGVAILLLKTPLPESYSLILEFGVGIMLVALGLQVFWSLRRREIHVHTHRHGEETHLHFHSHLPESSGQEHHGFMNIGKPEFRLKSYAIGVMHGLAGSAAITLLVLSTIEGFWRGIAYLFAFGVGTIVGMGTLTLLLGVPFAFSRNSERGNRLIKGVAGTGSIVFGVLLMAGIGPANTFSS